MGLIGSVVGGTAGIIGGIFGSPSKKPKELRGARGTIKRARFYPKELLQLQFPFVYVEKLFHTDAGLMKSRQNTENKETYMALPIPSGLAFSDGADFENLSLGTLMQAGGATEAVQDLLAGKSITDVGGGMLDKWKSQMGGLSSPDKMKALMVGAAKTLASDKIQAFTQNATKTIVNPYNNMTFQQNRVRTFTLMWRLAARDNDDTIAIHNIIKTFQEGIYAYGASDAGANSATLSFPDPWIIQFIDPSNSDANGMKYLPKIFSCYLTSFDHNYNEQSTLWHKDGSPITVNITCGFTETRTLTLNDIQAMESNHLQHVFEQLNAKDPASKVPIITANQKGSAQPNKSINASTAVLDKSLTSNFTPTKSSSFSMLPPVTK